MKQARRHMGLRSHTHSLSLPLSHTHSLSVSLAKSHIPSWNVGSVTISLTHDVFCKSHSQTFYQIR